MKRYSKATLDGLTPAAFAADVLQNELDSRDPMMPVSHKLRDAIQTLHSYDRNGLTYPVLSNIFRTWEANLPKRHLIAEVTFTEDSFEEKNLSWESRTYTFTSDNKAFQPNMSGYSIFARCLDGTDCGIRLEQYMAAEQGGKRGWRVESCRIIGEK